VNSSLIDKVAAPARDGYQLTRIHRIGSHTIRIHLYRDTDPHYSNVNTQVLTPALTWTDLCTDPPSRWHDAPSRTDLAAVADTLLHRTAAVLGAAHSAVPVLAL
jgi:hypothetical protein